MAKNSAAQNDIVIYGATSFVGQILCDYFVDRHGSNGDISWAIAGRNSQKLSEVATKSGADVDQIVADSTDPESLDALMASTNVVVSTVGPYALYGTPVIEAAVKAGVSYCDLTGETPWMRSVIDSHLEEAVDSGARIVHSCGFDSIPSDLGVLFTQNEALEKFESYCNDIDMRVHALKGTASGGTIASVLAMVEAASKDKELRKELANPYALAPIGHRTGVRQEFVQLPKKDNATGKWIAPFVMAGVNTAVVHRTNALLEYKWGKDFTYDEALVTGVGPRGAVEATGVSTALIAGMGAIAIPPVRNLLNRFVLPQPGEGPTPDQQLEGRFDIRFYATTDNGESLTTKVTGDRDPGYGSTAKMLGESAHQLLLTHGKSDAGGFWTPATALGHNLITALNDHAGIEFSVID